jgi:phosphoribosyl-dephospho-CoA transferase
MSVRTPDCDFLARQVHDSATFMQCVCCYRTDRRCSKSRTHHRDLNILMKIETHWHGAGDDGDSGNMQGITPSLPHQSLILTKGVRA